MKLKSNRLKIPKEIELDPAI